VIAHDGHKGVEFGDGGVEAEAADAFGDGLDGLVGLADQGGVRLMGGGVRVEAVDLGPDALDEE
jgi:hypothetical protein